MGLQSTVLLMNLMDELGRFHSSVDPSSLGGDNVTVMTSESMSAAEATARNAGQLQLYNSVLDSRYIHQLAAQTVMSGKPCADSEGMLEELAQLSLDRLNSDYESRKLFNQTGRDRAKSEFELAEHTLEDCRKTSRIPERNFKATAPEDARDEGYSSGALSRSTGEPRQLERERKVNPREVELNREIVEAENDKRVCAERLSSFEELGHSPTRSAAMRLFGVGSLIASAVMLAILFDPFTRDFPLLRDLLNGMRDTFMPTSRSESGTILGFAELLLLLSLPVALAFLPFMRTRSTKSPARSHSVPAWSIALCGIYGIALVATFSNGETASRLLLDFALALGCTAVTASIIFFSVTRSGRTHEVLPQQWWLRWEKILLPFAATIPAAALVFAATAGMAPWVKLIPAAILACVMMIGSVSLTYGIRYRDLQAAVQSHDARIGVLKAELHIEQQHAIDRAASEVQVLSAAINTGTSPAVPLWRQLVANAAGKLVPQLANTIGAHTPQRYAEAISRVVAPVVTAISPAQKLEAAGRSLRSYEAALTHLENRYSELLVQHATSWAMAKIDLRTAYALCRLGAPGRQMNLIGPLAPLTLDGSTRPM
jgi:hypothetical protein